MWGTKLLILKQSNVKVLLYLIDVVCCVLELKHTVSDFQSGVQANLSPVQDQKSDDLLENTLGKVE